MKIAHVSDLHFGCIDDAVRDSLLQTLHDAQPDLVIASGDITQSATHGEFLDAKAFFAEMKLPLFAVPGNHDLPGMDIERFVDPFGRYRKYIDTELDPEFSSELAHIKGLNSARMILPHWNWANGSVSLKQCRDLVTTFATSTAPWRLCVLHHPLMNPKEFPLDVALFNRQRALDALAAQRIDIVLAGHQHHAYIETREGTGHTTLFVSASTATSLRLRQQPNGFNMLHLTPTSLRVDMMRWSGSAFELFSATTHTKTAAV